MTNKVVLNYTMLSDIENLLFKIKPEDVDFSKITEYESQFNGLDHLRSEDFESLGLKTIHAMDLALDWFYVASRFAKHAHSQYDKNAAILYTDVVPALMTAQGVKDTDAARNRYIDKEPEYLKYKDIRDSWQLFADWLDKKRDSFLQKHMYIKKLMDMRASERN